MTQDLRDQLQDGLAGAYALENELTGGGMSRVFLATDTSLGRKVVVKVLHPDLAESLSAERFRREIQLAARLQHPHIVPLLAAGVLELGALYYTMPFVEGESLRERLDRDGELPVSEVTRLLCDMASALDYAHSQLVVHRDIKPENLLLSHGAALVTDFGIAKAIHASRAKTSVDARRSSTLTAAGTSLGTPAYMAPEQAAGDVVDHRADLYSLGVVAYEMLAGRPPFDGRSAHRLLAAHASESPEHIARRRRNVPPALATLVMQLLEKHPADRPQSAKEVLATLGARDTKVPRLPRRFAGPLVAALVSGMLASLATLWVIRSRGGDPLPAPVPRVRLTLDLPADAKLNPLGFGNSMTFSPDGATLVYVGGGPMPRLFSRRLDELTARPIAGTEGAMNPAFSPDGRAIGFVANLTLKRVPAIGGTPTVIAHAVGRFTWGRDDIIVFSKPSVLSPNGGLWRVSAAGGGTPVQLTRPDSALLRFHGSPAFLPDGRTVLFSSRPVSGDPVLAAFRLDDGKIRLLNVAGGSPIYVRDHIVFARSDGTIAAVRFDAKRLQVLGDPVTVLDNVALKAGGAAEMAVSPNGTLVYLTGSIGRQLVEVDRDGAARLLIPAFNNYRDPRVSPDGRRIALTVGPPPYYSDIWVYDISSGTLAPLTTGGSSAMPAWTPDGKRIAWTSIGRPDPTAPVSARGGIWWRPWDRSAPASLLIPGAVGAKFTPGGDSVITSFDVGNAFEVRLVPLPYDARRQPVVVLPARPEPRQPALSPDGHWLAYVEEEGGKLEVYIQPFPGPGGHFQVSSNGGTEPLWGRGSGQLLYRRGATMIAATLAFSPSVTVLRRDSLFVTDSPISVVEAMYDMMPNDHFVMVRNILSSTPPVVVFGWVDELRERMEAARRK